jgi:hypothetical protein
MKFTVVLKIENDVWDSPIIHEDNLHAISKSAVLKKFNLSGGQICELKNYGKTHWQDVHGSLFTLSLDSEAN